MVFEWILKRAKVCMVIFLLFVIVGIYTFISLPQREIPETTVNIGTVSIAYPGATFDRVERNITNPLEERLADIEGIEEINSSSSAGFSSIILTVTDGANKKDVFSNVEQVVSDVATTFPDNMLDPVINESTVKFPVVSYHLTSEKRENLYQLQQELDRWKSEVEEISGVEGVAIKGLPKEEIRILLDSDLLWENSISLPQVLQSINKEFYPTPLGKKMLDGSVVQLSIDHYSSIDELKKVLIAKDAEGNPVYLEDVGVIQETPKEAKDLITYKDMPSISFTAFVKPGEDIPSVDKAVQKKVEALSNHLPDHIKLQSFYSQANLVTEIFEGLFMSLTIALFAVIITTSLGLTLTGAFVVALAVPISLLMGLIPLPFASVDLNQISVIGAIIALGILVDDSIVVNDNIERHYRLGANALKGAVNGVKEIWVSIVTSSLAIVFTFLPLVFLSGGNGAFIRALPTILITTIIASTIVALFFVPIMRYLLYKKKNKKDTNKDAGLLGKPLNAIANFYADKVLDKFSKRPVLVSVISLLFTTAIFGLVAFTPFEFFPAADRKEVTVDVTLPIGTPLEETERTLNEMANLLETDAGVYETSIFAGTGLPHLFNSSLQATGEHTGQLVARVDRLNQTAQGLIYEWTNTLRDNYPEAQIFMETIEQGPPSGAPVTVSVSGPEIETLLTLRDTLVTEMKDLGAELVVDNVGSPKPTVEYVANREMLEDHNITIKDVSDVIRLATDGIPLAPFDDGTKRLDMSIFIDPVQNGDLDLSELKIASALPNNQGPPERMSLDEFVTFNELETIQRIPHINGERAITIRAFPGEVDNFKASVSKIVENVRDATEDPQYQISIGGENQAQDDFFAEITVLFLIVIFLVYLLIAFQFNSLSLPFLVLVAVYLAIAGAILGLFVTQTPISFLAVMGMVSLTGIVVRNSVVLIEFMEQGLRKGMSIQKAVIESGRARIRPILLTALTSIVALIPVAVSGDSLFTPLAITVISGILFSALLTLIVVPMMYLVFYKLKKKKVAIT